MRGAITPRLLFGVVVSVRQPCSHNNVARAQRTRHKCLYPLTQLALRSSCHHTKSISVRPSPAPSPSPLPSPHSPYLLTHPFTPDQPARSILSSLPFVSSCRSRLSLWTPCPPPSPASFRLFPEERGPRHPIPHPPFVVGKAVRAIPLIPLSDPHDHLVASSLTNALDLGPQPN
jgi:hypothetical protein